MTTRRSKKREAHPNPYMERAIQWFESSVGKDMFSSAGSVAKAAVAEYLANQDGTTLWPKESDA